MTRIGGMRIVAALIDVAILIVIAILIIPFMIFAIMGRGYAGQLIAGLVGAGISLAYFYTEVAKAQSPGKMLLKFQIMNQDGTPASHDQLMKRYLIKMAPTLIGVVGAILSFSIILSLLVLIVRIIAGVTLLVMALMMLRDNRLAYYDELCGTAVYGPGTAPQGFPVMPPATPGSAPMAPTSAPPPPTA
jgi:uncharacterized RDD family membrane protein YckC